MGIVCCLSFKGRFEDDKVVAVVFVVVTSRWPVWKRIVQN